ncbi:MAG: NifU family protein [Nitrososphaerales archaeon]
MDTLEERIKAVLARINREIGEDAALRYEGFEKGILKIRPSEACSDCKLLAFELQKGILNTIKEEVPEVLNIVPLGPAFAEAFCDKCHMPLEKCVCACPYCGKVEDCDCALGYGRATGG